MRTNPRDYQDDLGIFFALIQYMATGQDCDEIRDECIFTPLIQRLQPKLEIVIDENFGGDIEAFRVQAIRAMTRGMIERHEEPLVAIEKWLDESWNVSARLYA